QTWRACEIQLLRSPKLIFRCAKTAFVVQFSVVYLALLVKDTGTVMPSRRKFMLEAAAGAPAAPFIVRKPASAAPPIVRPDVMDMPASDRFFSDYAKAVQRMHNLSTSDGRNWINQARIHADYCHHTELEFLHWHRHYLRFFEQICAKLSD